MKQLNYISIILMFSIFFGCDFSLDLAPRNELTEGSFYTSEIQLNQALDDIYRQLSDHYRAYRLPDSYGELSSDNTHLLGVTGTEQDQGPPINEWVVMPGNPRISARWVDTYRAIYICNNIISRIEETTLGIDVNKLNRWKSEALAVRALFYFNLVRAWGGVPLVTKVVSPSMAYEILRASKDEVYEQIISDLKFAKEHLPANYSGSDVGRITRYGASGILAKVYLTIGENANAKSELEFIINSGQFSLVENYADNFHYQTKNNEESLLEAQYSNDPMAPNSNHHSIYKVSALIGSNPIQYTSPPGRGAGMNIPTQDLIDEYETGDPRRDASIFFGWDDPNTGEWIDFTFIWKFYDPDFYNAGTNFTIIRYADILLMYAEVTGDAEYLNMVRRRVGLPEWGTEAYPYDLYPTLERAIEHERRVELAFEFHRTFDLVRTGRLIEVMSERGIDIDNNKILWLIPQNVIDVNPAISQNPGY
jgi:starch-binding outer membrane protein, SusD/RagB family